MLLSGTNKVSAIQYHRQLFRFQTQDDKTEEENLKNKHRKKTLSSEAAFKRLVLCRLYFTIEYYFIIMLNLKVNVVKL